MRRYTNPRLVYFILCSLQLDGGYVECRTFHPGLFPLPDNFSPPRTSTGCKSEYLCHLPVLLTLTDLPLQVCIHVVDGGGGKGKCPTPCKTEGKLPTEEMSGGEYVPGGIPDLVMSGVSLWRSSKGLIGNSPDLPGQYQTSGIMAAWQDLVGQ